MSVTFLLIPALPPLPRHLGSSTELSARGAKRDIENTPNCILALQSRRPALAFLNEQKKHLVCYLPMEGWTRSTAARQGRTTRQTGWERASASIHLRITTRPRFGPGLWSVRLEMKNVESRSLLGFI